MHAVVATVRSSKELITNALCGWIHLRQQRSIILFGWPATHCPQAAVPIPILVLRP